MRFLFNKLCKENCIFLNFRISREGKIKLKILGKKKNLQMLFK